MKGKLIARASLAAVVALFVTVAVPARAAQCSLASVAGSYGYTTNGFVAIAPGSFVPGAAAGRIIFLRHQSLRLRMKRLRGSRSLN
jgi:hypothetical protein